MRDEVLRMEHITCMEDGAITLDRFSLHIFSGEIMGLLSTDSQGKKALVQLLQQNSPLHYGAVYYKEQLVNSYRHSSYTANNVAVIDKHSRLVEDLTVADNIFVLRRGFKKYWLNPRVLNKQLSQFTKDTGTQITGQEMVSGLSAIQKCVVQLLKAVVAGAKLVVLQDISNLISAAELREFHELLRFYAEKGMAILYVCSHHEESFDICDRVALMSDGRVLRLMEKDTFNEDIVWNYSLNFSRVPLPELPAHVQKKSVLRFDKVSDGSLQDVSFCVKAGECTVLLDVNNSTFADVLRLLQRRSPPELGSIYVGRQPLANISGNSPPVGIIQESPIKTMLFYEISYLDNLCFLAGEKNARLWKSSALRNSVMREYEALIGADIHKQDINGLPRRSLYNLVYYRQHLYNPPIVVCVQPFFGADMYLRHHIISLMQDLRKKGIAVLILAVNLSDSLVLADHLLVLEHGRLTAQYESKEFGDLDKNLGVGSKGVADSKG